MSYLYLVGAIGLVALVILALFAIRLYKVVRVFGQEVQRVSTALNAATSGLERATHTYPPREKPEA